MNRKLLSLLILAVLVIFDSCRSTKKLQVAINKKDTTIQTHTIPSSADSMKLAQSVLANLSRNHIDFKTFSAKIKVQYEGGEGKAPDLNAYLRMYKDSVIWITIDATFLSIEAFRILITRNHVTILNRVNKLVEEHPFSFIEDKAKIPLDFSTLQDLLIGNPLYIGSKVVAFKQTENHLLLSTIGKYFKNFLTLSVGSNNLVERSKLDDIDLAQNRTADLTYQGYEKSTSVYFPTYREITVAEKTKVDIRLNFKQYDFNKDLSFPFTIPKSYKHK